MSSMKVDENMVWEVVIVQVADDGSIRDPVGQMVIAKNEGDAILAALREDERINVKSARLRALARQFLDH